MLGGQENADVVIAFQSILLMSDAASFTPQCTFLSGLSSSSLPTSSFASFLIRLNSLARRSRM